MLLILLRVIKLRTLSTRIILLTFYWGIVCVRVVQVTSFILAVFVGVDDNEKKVYVPSMPFKSNPRVAYYWDPLGMYARPPRLVFVRIYKHNPAVEWTEPDVSTRFIMLTKSRLQNIYCLFTLSKVSKRYNFLSGRHARDNTIKLFNEKR